MTLKPAWLSRAHTAIPIRPTPMTPTVAVTTRRLTARCATSPMNFASTGGLIWRTA
jgi:hypothetical protein